MSISTSAASGTTTVTVVGRFDAHQVPAFKSTVQPLEKQPGTVIHLDLSDVRFIDSTALAELLRCRSALLAGRGDLVLSAVSGPVRVILELTGLESVFTLPTAAGRDGTRQG